MYGCLLFFVLYTHADIMNVDEEHDHARLNTQGIGILLLAFLFFIFYFLYFAIINIQTIEIKTKTKKIQGKQIHHQLQVYRKHKGNQPFLFACFSQIRNS